MWPQDATFGFNTLTKLTRLQSLHVIGGRWNTQTPAALAADLALLASLQKLVRLKQLGLRIVCFPTANSFKTLLEQLSDLQALSLRNTFPWLPASMVRQIASKLQSLTSLQYQNDFHPDRDTDEAVLGWLPVLPQLQELHLPASRMHKVPFFPPKLLYALQPSSIRVLNLKAAQKYGYFPKLVKRFAELTNLEHLNLKRVHVTADLLEVIANCLRHLTYLHLGYTGVCSNGKQGNLVPLSQLTALRHLNVCFSGRLYFGGMIGAASVSALGELRLLTELNLSDNTVNWGAFGCVTNLQQLQRLNLGKATFSNNFDAVPDIGLIAQLRQLKWLHLLCYKSNCQHISKLSSLQQLHYLKVTDKSLDAHAFDCFHSLPASLAALVVHVEDLGGISFNDKSMQQISKLSALRELRCSCTLHIDGMLSLCQLTKLTCLDLNVDPNSIGLADSAGVVQHMSRLGALECCMLRDLPYIDYSLPGRKVAFIEQEGVRAILQLTRLSSLTFKSEYPATQHAQLFATAVEKLRDLTKCADSEVGLVVADCAGNWGLGRGVKQCLWRNDVRAIA